MMYNITSLGIEIIDKKHLGLLESRLQEGGRLRQLWQRPTRQGSLRVVRNDVKFVRAENKHLLVKITTGTNTKNVRFKTVLCSRSRNYLRPRAGAEIIFLINTYLLQSVLKMLGCRKTSIATYFLWYYCYSTVQF